MPQTKKTSAVREAKPAECFWVNHGPVCKTVAELQAAIKTMSDAQYAYHTRRGSNDFATWMQDVMKHPQCAAKLARVRTQSGAVKVFDNCKD